LPVEAVAVRVGVVAVQELSVRLQAYLLPLAQHTQLRLVLVVLAHQLTLQAKALMVEILSLVL